jgi:hypothetical protein
MNCDKVRKAFSAFLDRKLDREASDSVTEHLAHCRDCSIYSEQVQSMHAVLRDLPKVSPSQRLITQLQVLASRERVRRLSHNTLSALMHFWGAELRLFVDNLMRPLAIPFTGGLLSSVCLFGMLMPTLQFQHLTHNDVPSGLFTQSVATVDALPPFGFSEDDVVVQLTLDDRGSVVDYAVPNGMNSKLRNDIANMILFTKFEPATEFGVPIAGKVLVSFRRIVVKG